MKTTFKVLCSMLVMVLMVAGISIAADLPGAIPGAPPSAPTTATLTPAAKSGPVLKVDGYIFAGKLYSVATSTEAELEKINLTTKKGSYLLSSEIGVRYGMVRPFIGYEAVTKDYEKKTLGMDIFFYDAGKLGAFGLRTAYSETKRTDIDAQFMYTGVLWKF